MQTRAGSQPRAAFELLSFAGYVALLWLVAGRATKRIGIRESVEVTLGGAAATRLLPTAGVGGAALTLWALRKTGMGARAAGRTLLTSWSCCTPSSSARSLLPARCSPCRAKGPGR